MAKITITGNTFPVKEELKALGARWNSTAKGWDVDENVAEQARQIVAGAPPKVARVAGSSSGQSSSHRPHYTKCQVCGVQADRYHKIYGSGECRDCYEERKMGY